MGWGSNFIGHKASQLFLYALGGQTEFARPMGPTKDTRNSSIWFGFFVIGPSPKSWHPGWTHLSRSVVASIKLAPQTTFPVQLTNLVERNQRDGKKPTWWKETECYLEHCKSARLCNPCLIYNDLSIWIMSILFISCPVFCNKSSVYILEQQGHFCVRMSKFWFLAGGGGGSSSDSEDVWLFKRVYVLSSSRSYKGENFNHLVAHKRILVGHNFELYNGIIQRVKGNFCLQISELQDLFQLSIQEGFWT